MAGKECVRQRVSRVEARSALAKVPRITVYFWIVKILTTAMGESTSDYLVHRFNPYLAVAGGFLAFVVALAVQLRVRVYVPWVYWLAVTMVAVFGTMAADVLHVEFRVPYIASTLFSPSCSLSSSQAGIAARGRCPFTASRRPAVRPSTGRPCWRPSRWAQRWAIWSPTEPASVSSRPASCSRCYSQSQDSGYRYFNLNAVFAFWFAYVMTRPLGASFADWMGKSHAGGGLNYGDGPVSLVLALLIVALVGYLSITGADRETPIDSDFDVAYDQSSSGPY